MALVLGAGGALAAFALKGHSSSTPVVAAPLAGLQKGKAPWVPEAGDLTNRLKKIGVPFSNMAGTALHIHPQLRIDVHGSRIAIPVNIGISPGGQSMAALHTHDESGTIHVESPVVRTYTLGEFFDVWGVRLAKQCLGGYCTNGTDRLAAFVDGKRYAADPRTIQFTDGKRIRLVYGTRAEIAQGNG